MKHIFLFLLLVGCATEPICVDRIVITKCDIDHKEKVICYKKIKCLEKR